VKSGGSYPFHLFYAISIGIWVCTLDSFLHFLLCKKIIMIWKETIINQNDWKKTITLCAYCEPCKTYTKKWEKLWYKISHWICEKCTEIFN
jgi:hypothetical protein